MTPITHLLAWPARVLASPERAAIRRALVGSVAAAIALAAGGAYYALALRQNEGPGYRLAKAERGEILSTVSASGSLSAVTTVLVGSQVSGQIAELNVDFNSPVKAGAVIARIDPSNFASKVREAEAQLGVSRANAAKERATVARTEADLVNGRAAHNAALADVEKSRVLVANARLAYARQRELFARGIIAQSDVDDARTAAESSQAQLNSSDANAKAAASVVQSREAQIRMQQAQVQYAEALVLQQQAALQTARIDLERTVIRSPVDGVVIDRSVDVGQTVAASLQAPTLFTIAQDLRKMQVNANVDEADIGRVRVGEPTTFTVDSFPGVEFGGEVVQIRKAPQVVQNVVTYYVIISADNPDLRLLPGMTANVRIIVERRPSALKVPNAALRYRPPGETGSAVSGAALAQPGQPGGGAAEGGAGSGRGNSEERLAALTRQLKLSEEQRQQVRAIFSETGPKFRALREQGLGPDEMRQERQRIVNENTEAIASMLTPEQREQFRQLRARRAGQSLTPGQLWTLADSGTPQRLAVLTGISDGQFTEVVRGELREGMQVITGGGPVPKAATSGSGPRLRF
ncbi:MAG: efflux RND transporter periplasmic adaptor subunit [Candidatus Lambdaproteobacteria bacterium]|nr:efflux RND transporter periplasmic adaptor subunit [Candidatus Lambdaproteobacteria bacterium]